MNLVSIFGIESLKRKFYGKIPLVYSLTFHAFLNSDRIGLSAFDLHSMQSLCVNELITPHASDIISCMISYFNPPTKAAT